MEAKILFSIVFSFPEEKFTQLIVDRLNQEYIKDRSDFRKESFIAARRYISEELPEVRILLEEAEKKLNDFKLSTNSVDVIFDADTRRSKLNDLQARLDGINFRELELKEFYKTNHPIYMTLSEQKTVLSQINSIEKICLKSLIDREKLKLNQRSSNLFRRHSKTFYSRYKFISQRSI